MNRQVFIGISVGCVGAALATAIGLPAGALVGSAIATGAACVIGLRFAIPIWITRCAFVVVGIAMGSGVSPDVLGEIDRWILSILIMSLSLFLVLFANTAMLMRVFNWDQKTAILASAPGALSSVVALAAEGHGDVARVSIAQSIRLILITLMVPAASLWITFPELLPRETSFEALLLMPLAYGIGWVFLRWKVPTAFLLSGLLISALIYLTGLIAHPPNFWITFPGFVLIGSLIGSRFSGVGPKTRKSTLYAGLALTLQGGAIAMFFAYVSVRLVHIDPASAAIAFAPGGVEGMGAMALALNAAPAFVAAHHLTRILLVSIFIPAYFARQKNQ